MWSVCSLLPTRGGTYIPQNNSKICIRLFGRSLGGTRLGLIPERFKLSCLTAFPLFLHSITSLISNYLSLHFGTQGRPKRGKHFKSTSKRWAAQRSFVSRKVPQLSVWFQFPLFSDTPQSWRERGKRRNRIKFWMESLIINSTGELDFGGDWL